RRGGRLEEDADALDVDTLVDVRHHGGGIGPAEVDLALTDGLSGLRRALARLDRKVDAVLFEDALFDAVVERCVLPVRVPVEYQRDRGRAVLVLLGGGRAGSRAAGEQQSARTDERGGCEKAGFRGHAFHLLRWVRVC